MGLLPVVSILAFAHAISRIQFDSHPDSPGYRAFNQLFDLSAEANVPTWFTTVLWFAAALLAAGLARQARSDGKGWTIVALVCAFLSLDEAASLHERLGEIGSGLAASLLPQSLGFIYAWTIFGIAFLAAVIFALAPFILRLPLYASTGIVIAGAIFVTGAIGFENLGAAVEPLGWTFKGVWLLLSLVEEVLEMIGVIVFLHVLLWMMEREPTSSARPAIPLDGGTKPRFLVDRRQVRLLRRPQARVD